MENASILKRITGHVSEKQARYGLDDDCRRCEKKICEHDDPGRASDDGGITRPMREQHKERDTGSRAEKHCCPQDVQVFAKLVKH